MRSSDGRARLVRLAGECMGTAANPAKGGFVREALINQYPKLAALLEDTLHKIRRDTEVPPACPFMCLNASQAVCNALHVGSEIEGPTCSRCYPDRRNRQDREQNRWATCSRKR